MASSSSTSSDTGPVDIYAVISPYIPVSSDEVRLNVGVSDDFLSDHVLILQEFDDGWITGKKLLTGEAGFMPRNFLTAKPIIAAIASSSSNPPASTSIASEPTTSVTTEPSATTPLDKDIAAAKRVSSVRKSVNVATAVEKIEERVAIESAQSTQQPSIVNQHLETPPSYPSDGAAPDVKMFDQKTPAATIGNPEFNTIPTNVTSALNMSNSNIAMPAPISVTAPVSMIAPAEPSMVASPIIATPVTAVHNPFPSPQVFQAPPPPAVVPPTKLVRSPTNSSGKMSVFAPAVPMSASAAKKIGSISSALGQSTMVNSSTSAEGASIDFSVPPNATVTQYPIRVIERAASVSTSSNPQFLVALEGAHNATVTLQKVELLEKLDAANADAKRYPEVPASIGSLKMMVVGDSGIGKTKLIKAITAVTSGTFEATHKPNDNTTEAISEYHVSTIPENSLLQGENPYNLTFVDCPGFGSQMDAMATVEPVVSYVLKQFGDTDEIFEKQQVIPNLV
ncbi:hypothetical protein HDU76_004937, partial [Blyttiomyces sp. JEL0837]